ncbi:NADH dehydrogenase [ubiquinone] 1 alpha subcomplex subunit 2 [Anabrus simplex]|uniref:NADH dehydrogenase [ubiquinone] 1 alpha subcomplex subunit 2 n=1 Tax=Anabrus simplex TaxID=316456 RepID=UPI0035A323A4
MASRMVKFSPHLKELRIHLCQTSNASKGVRDFIEQNYVQLKKNNPKFPILVRECSGIQPRMYARYGQGKEISVALTNMKVEDVQKQLETLATKK